MIDAEDQNLIPFRARETDKNYSKAIKVYDEFARKKGFPLSAILSTSDLQGKRGNLIGLSYAAFLLEYRQGNSQVHYVVNTILECYKG